MIKDFVIKLLIVILISNYSCYKFNPKDLIRRPKEEITTSSEYIEMIEQVSNYYKYFMAYAYCKAEDKGQCCKSILPQKRMETSEDGWTLINYGKSNSNCYSDDLNNYVILRNDILKKIVIAFPGTYGGALQGITEFLFSQLVKVDLIRFQERGIYAGLYFYERARDILKIVFSKENRKNMKIDEDYQVIFTGHSLGGVTSEIVALLALDRGYVLNDLNYPVIITYGTPRAGNDAFAYTLQQEVEVIFRNINIKDVVPEVPFYPTGFRHTNGKVYLSSDKETYKIENTNFNYQINNLTDSQGKSVFEITKTLIHGFGDHIYYYGINNSYCYYY